MTDALAVIVPTRGRPANAARLTTAFRETHALDAVAVFVADHDDPALPEYRRLLDEEQIPRLIIPPQSNGMCSALNYAATRYAEVYDYVGFMGDDHLPRTANWDSRVTDVLDSLEPRIVYGDDLLQGAALPTAVFMQSRIVRALHFMAPPQLHHLYLDNFWKELGERTGGLRYLPDVVIEHLHPVAGKAVWDEGYRRVNAASVDQADKTTWDRIRAGEEFEWMLRAVRREYGL